MESKKPNLGITGPNTERLKFDVLWKEDHSGNDWDNSFFIARAKVLGGWLVFQSWDKSFKERVPGNPASAGGLGIGTGLAFVPDPDHKWNPDDYLN